MAIAKGCLTVDELVTGLQLTLEQIDDMERSTRGQAANPKWMLARKGRLTASNFYRIHTRMETLKTKPGTDLSKLIKSLNEKKDIGFLPAIQHGKLTEPIAVKFLLQLLSSTHTHIKFQECGLFVDYEMPFLGASPDGEVRCKCHGIRLVEVKCPTRALVDCDFLSEGKLKKRHNYYGQVQGQMMMAGARSTYFLTYKSDDDYLLDVIDYDAEFCTLLRDNLYRFYHKSFAPSLLNQASQMAEYEEDIDDN